MISADMQSRVRGCVLGAVLGDAIGGPFEFGPLDRAPALAGGTWIDGLYPYARATGPHGVWPCPPPGSGLPPPGTGTDDTRYNWLFLELATELGHMPTGYELATRFLEAYQDPAPLFPGHAALTRKQFEFWEGVCRGYLNQTSDRFPGFAPDLLLARSLGLNFPVLSGLITLTFAGLLFPGDPETAYREAFRTDFYDIGYAREAVALLAASTSIALAQEIAPRALLDRVVALDPLHLGGEFSAPFVREHLPQLCPLLDASQTDQALAQALSAALRHFHPFDPFRALAVAFLAVMATPGDPLRAILIAVNHVGLDQDGHPTRYEDIDCYGGIAGALAGVLSGAEAFPPVMLEQVVRSNRQVYGVDLEASIQSFMDRFFR